MMIPTEIAWLLVIVPFMILVSIGATYMAVEHPTVLFGIIVVLGLLSLVVGVTTLVAGAI